MLIGLETSDDAGVYQISDDIALIQTVDFFTPIVDDPFTFGQIAAANALSDVYAMGGTPITAMNLVSFPKKHMPISVLGDILRGGLDKLRESGTVLVGGHSVEDPELKYGLSITGTVHPKRVLSNRGALPGDGVILTKPLGTGIINTAIKAGLVDSATIAQVTRSMMELNKRAAEVMAQFEVHCCTDATGFGLLGHAAEIIEQSDVGMHVHFAEVPVFANAIELSKKGLMPGGLFRNRDYRSQLIDFMPDAAPAAQDILFDPQTSGGLIIVVAPDDARPLLDRLHQENVEHARLIGEITADHPGRILVTS